MTGKAISGRVLEFAKTNSVNKHKFSPEGAISIKLYDHNRQIFPGTNCTGKVYTFLPLPEEVCAPFLLLTYPLTLLPHPCLLCIPLCPHRRTCNLTIIQKTGLSCHIHGVFEIKSSRSGLEWNQDVSRTQWNQILITDVISDLYP